MSISVVSRGVILIYDFCRQGRRVLDHFASLCRTLCRPFESYHKKSWVCGNDPITQVQLSLRKFPSLPKPKNTLHVLRAANHLFWKCTSQWILSWDSNSPSNLTWKPSAVSVILYFLNCQTCQWHIPHDKASSHTVQLVKRFLVEYIIALIYHPSYSLYGFFF